jgi:hypothetical protein
MLGGAFAGGIAATLATQAYIRGRKRRHERIMSGQQVPRYQLRAMQEQQAGPYAHMGALPVELDDETIHRLRYLHGHPGSAELRSYGQGLGGAY